MKWNTIVAAAAALVLTACHFGKNAADLPVARSPDGVTLQLYTTVGRTEGQLLSVRDDGVIVVLRDGRIVLVPFAITNVAHVNGMSKAYQYGSRIPPSSEVRRNLVLVSHFPQGMSEEIQSRLLASKGQPKLVVLQ